MLEAFLSKLRKYRRKSLIKWYGLKNVHPDFLATNGLKNVSKDIVAGAFAYIGPRCIICPKVSIGNYTMLANDVSIIGGDHNFRTAGIPTVFNGRDELKATHIGNDVWIGCHSIIMAGVTIGDGVIVAAGSVVTKDLEPFGVYAGIPAKKIKERFSDKEKEMHIDMLNLSPDKLNYLCDTLLSSHSNG